MIIWIVLVCILIFISYYVYLYINNSKNDNNLTEKSYIKKEFMSESEKRFYLKLKKLDDKYIIIPQVNLASIINKVSNQKYNTELFRNIDFGIFDKDFNLLLLIELNDSTHNTKRRKSRDIKVKNICNSANIDLITFYTSYPNEENYVLNRVINALEKKL